MRGRNDIIYGMDFTHVMGGVCVCVWGGGGGAVGDYLYYKISGVSECATDVTSPCLDRVYSCGTVGPACKVGSGQLHVYIDELLRGNLQKRERLGGKPTPTP